MDYTKVPRALIYEDHRSLEDFDAYEEGSITRPFLDELLKFGSDSYPNIEENALWCLNNAFYICTMMLLEKDPRSRIYQYKKVATREYIKDRFISDKYWSAVLSMVILLLQRLETPLTRFQDEARQNLLGLIDKNTNNDCVKTFNCFSKRLKEDTSTPKKIPNSMFAPRVIDKFAIKDVLSEKDFCWVKFTNYLDERYIHDIVKAFGTTEEEKHNVVEMIRQASHSFYLMGGTNDRIEEVDRILNNIDNEIEFQFNPGGKKVSKETLVNEKQFDPTTYEDRISELEEQDRKPKEQSPAISADNEVAEKIKSLEEQLAKEKEKNEKLEKDVEFHKNERNEMLKELLLHIIHKESDVEEFLELVDGRSDPEIIDIVKQWGTSEKITRKMKNRPLWQILHAAKIYKTGEPNWNAGLRKD